jgi:hypothetical protein
MAADTETSLQRLEVKHRRLPFSSSPLISHAGPAAIAAAIPDMRALSLLNLTDNCIGEARVQKIKEMCGSRNISLLIN